MNILTFDVEDWYNCDFNIEKSDWGNQEVRLYENIKLILDELEIKKIKGTFFCLGWIAEKHPQIIKDIANAGHQIGCHSYQHELVTRNNSVTFKEDTYRAKSIMEDLLGSSINIYRAPGFSITTNTLWAFDVLASLGFTHDSSIFPAHHDYGGMPVFGKSEPTIIQHNGISFKEFPISVQNIFGHSIVYSGGGYFRLCPYFFIKKLSQQTEYLMTYFHPRDFDPNQPKVKNLSFKRQFKSYVGLENSFSKFCKYINNFEFINIAQADTVIDWEKVRTLDL